MMYNDHDIALSYIFYFYYFLSLLQYSKLRLWIEYRRTMFGKVDPIIFVEV